MEKDMKLEIIKEGKNVIVSLDSVSGVNGMDIMNVLSIGVEGTIEEVSRQMEMSPDELMQIFLMHLVERITGTDEEV